MDKKKVQLGMNPGTAQGRLVKDLLFKFVSEVHPNCYRCGEPLTRETFSIEHKTPWLDSDDPVGLFFDLNNIDFSHQVCNYGAARKSNRIYSSAKERSAAAWSRYSAKYPYDSEKRRQRYLRNGS